MRNYLYIRNNILWGIFGVLAVLSLTAPIMPSNCFALTMPLSAQEHPKEATPSSDVKTLLEENHIKTFEDYWGWVNVHLRYQPDATDQWKDPSQTMLSGYGDCEDLAFLHEAVLKTLGYEAKVLSIGKGNKAHVFTLFGKGGRLYLFDNLKLHAFQTSSADQAVRGLMFKFHASFLLQLNYEQKSITVLYAQDPRPLTFRQIDLRVIDSAHKNAYREESVRPHASLQNNRSLL